MGMFDNMKAKLGFGGQPEWQDDAYQDEYGQPYEDGTYAEQNYEQDDYVPNQAGVVSFDTYNPSNFGNVKVDGDRDLKVASLDGADSDSYFGRRESYASSIGTSSARSSSSNVRSINDRGRDTSSGPEWDTPSDPSFLDNKGKSTKARSASELLSSSRRKPEDHLVIVKINAYSDVQKVATAVRSGSKAVLVLTGTRAELAKRALDFSFGAAAALDGSVDKASDKVFVISKDARPLTDAEKDYLKEQKVI